MQYQATQVLISKAAKYEFWFVEDPYFMVSLMPTSVSLER